MINIEDVLIALANRHRLSILRSIVGSESKGIIVGAATELMPVNQSTTSFHLIKMRKAGVLTRVDSGRIHIYSINTETIKELIEYLNNVIKECEKENHNEAE